MDKRLKEQKVKTLRREARRDYGCNYLRVCAMRSHDLSCTCGLHAKWSAVSSLQWTQRIAMQLKMVVVSSETVQGFQQLFKDISSKFSSVKSENNVKVSKNSYGGKFDLLDNRDLLEGLHLLKKHGYVSDNILILI